MSVGEDESAPLIHKTDVDTRTFLEDGGILIEQHNQCLERVHMKVLEEYLRFPAIQKYRNR